MSNKASPNPFISKLWELLSRPENWAYIRWNEDGDAIEILEPDGLMVNVLPKYFRQGKLCSFVRQLNLYGFEKQKEKWEFKQQDGLFRRGAGLDKLVMIKRRAQTKKKRSDVFDEEHLEGVSQHVDKKREIIANEGNSNSLDLDFSMDATAGANVPTESLQTYEERQSVQEAAIHYLMEGMQQQKQDISVLRNQVTLLQNYILNNPHQSPAPNFAQFKPLASPPVRQLLTSQQVPPKSPYPQVHNAHPFQQLQQQNSVKYEQPRQRTPGPSPTVQSQNRVGSGQKSPSTDSDVVPTFLRASNTPASYSTPNASLNFDSISSEFSTVNVDEQPYSIFNDLPLPDLSEVEPIPSHWM